MSPKAGLALAAIIVLATTLGCQPGVGPTQASTPSSPPSSLGSAAPAKVAPAQPAASPANPVSGPSAAASTGEGVGAAAIRKAAQAGKHVYLLFHEAYDEATRAAATLLTATVAKATDKAEWATVKRSDPREKGLVDTYGLLAAPMPLILVLAPNGAVTSGFRAQDVNEEKLLGALASPVQASCLKAMQSRKIVVLCVQGKATSLNAEAMKGVDAFKADARFSGITEVVRLDPADPAESAFLRQLSLDSSLASAATLLLAPPRSLLATFKGATDKEQFVAILTKAASGGCGSGGGGCGPSGCN